MPPRTTQPTSVAARVSTTGRLRWSRIAWVAIVVSVAALGAEAADPPRVRLVATGGTISNRPGERLTADELVESIPDLSDHATVETEQFANVASSALTLADWLRLSRRINELFASRSDLAGIVVTSGTDTLEETAFFLHLTVRSERPVVVVGAMRNPSLVGYDGSANLLQAFRVAAAPASRGKGALVVLNGRIDSARDVTKSDTRSLDTFTARTRGILGLVDSDRVVYYRSLVSRHTFGSEFDVTTLSGLPRVDIIMVYQGASGDLITAAAAAGAQGIVVASAGVSATTRDQRDALAAVAERGPVIVMSSRTGGGRVPAPTKGASSSGSREFPRVRAEDLSPIKARILLMLALTKTNDTDEIQRMFGEY